MLVDLLSYTGTKGGMEIYARELYKQLGVVAPDWEFVGFFSREGYQLDRSWFPGATIDSRISGENRFIWAWGELFAVARAARALDADLVHCPAILGPRRTTMPTVVTMHDMLFWSHPEFMSTPLYTEPVKWMERVAARNATRILTISDESRRAIIRYLNVPSELIDMVPLAGTRVPGADRSLASQPVPFVLATGQRRAHKNWASLIRALPLVPEEHRPRLVITGSHGEDPLRSVVVDTGMDEWVELKSWVDDDEMRELYSRATILAMPSFADGFSLPALEAMMAGLPVMISDIPVYREVVGDAALLIDPTSLDSIAAAMETAVTNPELMNELSVRGRERAALFSWERTARATLRTFERALEEPRPL